MAYGARGLGRLSALNKATPGGPVRTAVRSLRHGMRPWKATSAPTALRDDHLQRWLVIAARAAPIGRVWDGTRLTGRPRRAFGPQGSGLPTWCTSWASPVGCIAPGALFATPRNGHYRGAGERIAVDAPAWWRDWMTNVAHRAAPATPTPMIWPVFYEAHPIGPRNLLVDPRSRQSRPRWHREGRMKGGAPYPFC